MKFSIIMPVYNSIDFLPLAIESILNQTLKEFELILINDQSTDGSGKLCEEYLKKDSRIRVHHNKSNLGISKTRNVGLQMAGGDYIAFSDDDDLLLPSLLEDNYQLALECNADMVKFGRKLIDVSSDGKVIRIKETKGTEKMKILVSEKYESYYKIKKAGYLTNIWNGIYRKDLLKENNIRFDERMKFGSEDMDFSIQCYQGASVIAIQPSTYYIHYRRDGSSTSRIFNENKIDSMLNTAKREMELWEKVSGSQKGKIQRNRLVTEYYRNIIMIQLFHKDCDYTTKEKVARVRKLRELPQMQLFSDKEMLIKMWRTCKKDWLTTKLIISNNVRMLLFVLFIYQHLFGDKWSK